MRESFKRAAMVTVMGGVIVTVMAMPGVPLSAEPTVSWQSLKASEVETGGAPVHESEEFLLDHVVNRLFTTSHYDTSYDWTGCKITLSLSAGDGLFNHPLGSDGPEWDVIFIVPPWSIFMDTHVRDPMGNFLNPGFTDLLDNDGSGTIGDDDIMLDGPGTLTFGWYDSVVTANFPQVWLAQLTLAPNSLGSLHLKVSTDEALSPFEYDFAVINGYVVPEPATLSLVAIGSMACLGLRRRSHAP